MTQQVNDKATLSTPVDMKKDQVDESRRVLREMWAKEDRAIDEQTGRRAHPKTSDQCPLLGAKQTSLFALHMSAFDPKRTYGSALLP